MLRRVMPRVFEVLQLTTALVVMAAWRAWAPMLMLRLIAVAAAWLGGEVDLDVEVEDAYGVEACRLM